ncbi:hypothetical protein GJ744_001960 [Endocarpon pusillum]|uniref:FAS1 domain-containing protein n=1 Tax=Endocarpon pusillum TaxID=364733 RepID=A0A8H7ABY2_9EURO|nr:hypothetical protein GJ744_001960 [Endocarpon pusillum]
MRNFHRVLLIFAYWWGLTSGSVPAKADGKEAQVTHTAIVFRPNNHLGAFQPPPSSITEDQRTAATTFELFFAFVLQLLGQPNLLQDRHGRLKDASSLISVVKQGDTKLFQADSSAESVLGKEGSFWKRQVSSATLTGTAASTTTTFSGGTGNNNGNNSGGCSGNGNGGGNNDINCSVTTNQSSSNASGGGLTKEAKIGIGIAVATVVVAIIAAVMTYIQMRRTRTSP